jgi:hypothetical protein
MATLQQSIVALQFALADAPAAPGGAVLPPAGIPDAVDLACIPMPATGTIVGIAVVGSPAAGDQVSFAPTIGASPTGAGAAVQTSLLATITSTQRAANAVVSKDQSDGQFNAGQYVGVLYSTSSTGTYTPRDVQVVLFVSTGRTDL